MAQTSMSVHSKHCSLFTVSGCRWMGIPPCCLAVFTHRTFFVTSCGPPCRMKLFQKGSTVKGKNMLLRKTKQIVLLCQLIYIFTIISMSQDTVRILCIGTDRSQQTVQTKIRLLLKKQSDQGLCCLPFHQHLLDALMQCYIKLFYF